VLDTFGLFFRWLLVLSAANNRVAAEHISLTEFERLSASAEHDRYAATGLPSLQQY
jgi:hypothetical protein